MAQTIKAIPAADDLVKITVINPEYFVVYNTTSGPAIMLKLPGIELEDIRGRSVNINNIKRVTIVRKENSIPSTITDGVTIVTLKQDNANDLSVRPYIDTTAQDGKLYYYRLFISGVMNTQDNMRNSVSITVDLTSSQHIYGFKIRKSESDPATRVEYTDDNVAFTPMSVTTTSTNYGSWADSFIIKNTFRPVALTYDGVVDYELNHDDQTKKLDGTASDISNADYQGNMMVEVKKLYMYCYEDSEYEYCKIANYPVDSNYTSYAFVNDAGESVNQIYLPMFKGSNINNRLRSIADQAPQSATSGATEISLAQANGEGWYIRSWSEWVLIQNLLILLGKSTDTQSVFGSGHQSGGSSAESLLTTGTLKNKGMFYGDPATNSNVAVKVFWLENWYGDRWDRTAGCIINSTTNTICVKPSRPFNGNSTNGYIDTELYPVGTSGGYISTMKMTKYGLIPKSISGSSSTYYTDGCWFATGERYALTGGACHNGLRVGALYVALNISFAYSDWILGASPSFS